MNSREILNIVINEINNPWWNNKGISTTETGKNNAPPEMIRQLRKIFGGIYGNTPEHEVNQAINEAIKLLEIINSNNLKTILPVKYGQYESYLTRLKSIQVKPREETLKNESNH